MHHYARANYTKTLMKNRILDSLFPICVVFYAALCVLYRPFVADDAYIVGRYALNAADGLGLVYNTGEYVSALTSPLHALLVTALAFLSDDPVTVYRLISPLFPLIGLMVAFRVYQPDGREKAVVAVFGLASPFLALWAVGGLETPILSAVLTMFVAFIFKSARTGVTSDGSLIALGVLAALAFLTRQESILVTAPLMFAAAILNWRRPMLWIAGGISAAIVAMWFGFAYFYYGDILPTSAYIKLFDERIRHLSVVTLLNVVVVSGAIVALVFLISQPRSDKNDVTRIYRRGALISAGLFLPYTAWVSGAHMMFGYRMFVPLLIPVAMVFGAYLVRARPAFLTIQAGLQCVVAVLVLTNGLTVQALTNFGRFGSYTLEFTRAVPSEFGVFSKTLKQNAEDLNAHWDAQGIERQPKVFLYTGGMGYWLRDFYVYESLISYRRACVVDPFKVVAATDYVQDFTVSANKIIRKAFLDSFEGAPMYETVGETRYFMSRPMRVVYNYAPPRRAYPLSKTLNDPC